MSAEDHAKNRGADSVVEVPYRELSPEALYGLAESFVLREGTDYGEHAYSLAQKVEHVLAQLRKREATIVFNPATGGIDIVLSRQIGGIRREPADEGT
tara:strand:+ start:3139 stop:3432 length:294 start_codon:yes stop_codon:yes gene_type:complete